MASLRRRRVPAFLNLLYVLAVLAVVGAGIALLFVDESRDTRFTLCAVVGAGVAVAKLISGPAARPVAALAGNRRRGVAAFGRLLVVVFWLLHCAVAGAAAAYIAWNSDSAEVQPLAAGLVAVSLTLVVFTQVGQHLAGFVTAIDDLRGRGLGRRLVAIVVAAVTAGVAGYLAALVEHFRKLVTDPVWNHLHDQWGWPGFLAGALVVLLTILVVTLAAVLVGTAMLSLAFAVRPWTRLGRWLLKYSPVKYTRWIDAAHISVVGFSASFPKAPNERATQWIYRSVRDSTGPLHPVFLQMLIADVERAVPAGSSVVLRAVGDHEEMLLEHADGGAEVLRKFAEAAALRRIRTAVYNPEIGLPSEVRCSPPATEWEEPEWASEPSHEDLVKEVVRYPPGPPWVRERLGLSVFS